MAANFNISSTTEESKTSLDEINMDDFSGTFVEKLSLLLNEKPKEYSTDKIDVMCNNSKMIEQSFGLLPLSTIEEGEDYSFDMNVSHIIKRLEENETSTPSTSSAKVTNCTNAINQHKEKMFDNTLDEIAYILERNSEHDTNPIIFKHMSKNSTNSNCSSKKEDADNVDDPARYRYLKENCAPLQSFTQEDYNLCDTSDDSIGLQHLSKIEEEDSYETSHTTKSFGNEASVSSLANITDNKKNMKKLNEKFDKSNANQPPQAFNDTLEEIEYILSTKADKQTEPLESTLESPNISLDTIESFLDQRLPEKQQGVIKQSKLKNKFENILSPVACYIKQTPTRIVNKNLKTPASISTPRTMQDNYKNILSPVAVYINNSPYSPLKQTAQPKKMDKENILLPNTFVKVGNSTDESLKTKIYRPSTIKQYLKSSDPKMPNGICKLLTPPSEVTKHNHLRLNVRDPEQTLDGDLTAMATNSGDISILASKKFY